VFVSAKYDRSTKSDDAMYVWLENVNSGSFEVCLREFLPFDGKHQDTIVVREISLKGLGHAILGNFSTDQIVIELTKISKKRLKTIKEF